MMLTPRRNLALLALAVAGVAVSASTLFGEDATHLDKVASVTTITLAAALISAVCARVAATAAVSALLQDEDDDEGETAKSIPLEFIDQEAGVADVPRLFIIREYEMSTGQAVHWLLTIAPGVTPSDVLALYPELADPDGPVEYRSVPISKDHQAAVLTVMQGHTDAQTPSVEEIAITFRGPSEDDSFAIRVDRIVAFLCEEFRHIPHSPEGGMADALTRRMRRIIDLDASVEQVTIDGITH